MNLDANSVSVGTSCLAASEQVSGGALQLNVGTLYPALMSWYSSTAGHGVFDAPAANG
jgi:hypothetical protein